MPQTVCIYILLLDAQILTSVRCTQNLTYCGKQEIHPDSFGIGLSSNLHKNVGPVQNGEYYWNFESLWLCVSA